ncbi:MAG TPA: hypothetical protein VN616_00335 [Puia sp.]|nr:hypothetical protein [Puia sp.]
MDIWQYDPPLDVWTLKANFPANVPTPFYLVGFSPDSRFGFVAGGAAIPSGGIDLSEVVFWRYDPASDSWMQMHNIPDPGMLFPSAMVLNGTAYVLGGGQDCWKYDQPSDTWTQVAFFGYRLAGSAFAINGTGYFGMGEQRFSNLPYIDLWQYTP